MKMTSTHLSQKSLEMEDLLEKWKIFKQNIGLQQQDSTQPNWQNFISHWRGEKHIQNMEKRGKISQGQTEVAFSEVETLQGI